MSKETRIMILVIKNYTGEEKENPLREYFRKVNRFIKDATRHISTELKDRNIERSLYTERASFDLCKRKDYQYLVKMYNINKMEGYIKYKELSDINKAYKESYKYANDKYIRAYGSLPALLKDKEFKKLKTKDTLKKKSLTEYLQLNNNIYDAPEFTIMRIAVNRNPQKNKAPI